MRIVTPGTIALIQADASEKIFRLDLSVPGELYLFIDGVADLSGSDFTIRTRATGTPVDFVFQEGTDYTFGSDFGAIAQEMATAVQQRDIEGVWAEAEFDGARSGLLRIIIATTQADDDVRLFASAGNWRRINEDRRNGTSITLSTADAGHEGINDFGMILSVEPLRQAMDPITRTPSGTAFLCEVRATDGLKRLLSYHPIESFEVQVSLGVRDRNVNDTPDFLSLGRWWMEDVEGNQDGTITISVKDAVARVANNLVPPVQFSTLHPSQAVLLHLHAAGLSNNNGVSDASFAPTAGAANKGHFVCSHNPVTRLGGDTEPNAAETQSESVLSVISDFLTLTGDALRVAGDGDLELVTFDAAAAPVAHLRAGPETGFDATPVQVVGRETINRITWNVATTPDFAADANERGKRRTKITQVLDSARSQTWLGRIFDLSIDNPYIARSTRGWGPCSGSEYNDPANVGNRSTFAQQQIYLPGAGIPGGPYNPTTRIGVFSPHASGWCGFRLLQPDGNSITSLVYEDSVASLSAAAGRWAFIRLDPPGLYRDNFFIPPAPNSLGRQEILPGDADYEPEIIAVDSWELNNGTELHSRVQYLTTPINDILVQGPDGNNLRYVNIIPPPPFDTTVAVQRFLFTRFGGQISTSFNGSGDITGGAGRGVLGTRQPFIWTLAATNSADGATMTDVTIPLYRSQELFSRFEFGAPEIEFETSLAWISLEVADVITIDDPTYVGFRRIGLDSTITFEITEVEIHWYSDSPRIRFRAVALRDTGQTARFSERPVTVRPWVPGFGDIVSGPPQIDRGGFRGTPGLGVFRNFRSSLNQFGFFEHVAQQRRAEGEFGDFVIADYDFADQPAICGRVSVQAILVNATSNVTSSFELATHFDWDPDVGGGAGMTLQKAGINTVLEEDGPTPGPGVPSLEIVTNILGDTGFRLRVQGTVGNEIVVAAHVKMIALSPETELIQEEQSDLSGEELLTGGGTMDLTL